MPKIIKYEKKTNGIYKIYLDNGATYNLYEEIILKHDLLLIKEINRDTLPIILTENRLYESYYTGLSLINKYFKTKHEVTIYLKNKDYTKDEISFAIAKLEDQGYINDKLYSTSFVHKQIITTSRGPQKIIAVLLKKGIAEADYQNALTEFTKELEEEKVSKIISKRIKANHTKSVKFLKRKLEMDLLNEGFNRDIVKKMLLTADFKNDLEIARAEYKKYYTKFSRKYNGKELDYKLNQKMHSLGFNDYHDN